jgi:tellurite resistance protein TehA-like permease
MQSMKAWQIATLAYAVLYFILVSAMEAENISQSYPVVYVALSMIAQVLVVLGTILFGLDADAGFARFWRWLFPLLVLEPVVGLWFDATIPTDAFEPGWILNVGLSLWIMAPAYYLNFRIARYRRAERGP